MTLTDLWADSGPIKRATMVTALVGAILGVIVTASGAYKVAEPHLLTSRGFVREALDTTEQKIKIEVLAGDNKTGSILKDVLRWQVRSELATTIRERDARADRIKSHESILARDKDMAADARRLIEEQIATLRGQQIDAEERISELRRELAAK